MRKKVGMGIWMINYRDSMTGALDLSGETVGKNLESYVRVYCEKF